MTKLIFLQRPRYNKEIIQVIKLMNDVKVIICCDLKQYLFFKKKIYNGEIKVIYLKQSFFQKLIYKIKIKFSKKSIFQIILIKLLSKINYEFLKKIISKYRISKIYTDFNFYDQFFLPLKMTKEKNKIELNLFYFFEDSVHNKNIYMNSLQYEITGFIKILILINKIFYRKTKTFKIFDRKLISRYSLSQIFFINLFKIDVGNVLSRLVFPIFDNIYCLSKRIRKNLISVDRLSKKKISVIMEKKLHNKKYKFDFLVTTHPFADHLQMEKKNEYRVNENILKTLKKFRKKVLLYIHPNNHKDEKLKYKNLAKKYDFDSMVGGNFYKDIADARICLSNCKSTVVTQCKNLNIPVYAYDLPYNQNIFPYDLYHLNPVDRINQRKTNKVKIFKNNKALENLIKKMSMISKIKRYNSVYNQKILKKI